MKTILIFGDSIAFGGNDPLGGWATKLFLKELRADLNGEEHFVVFNLSNIGVTSRDVLSAFNDETLRRIEKGQESIVLISIGVNDAARENNKNLVPLDEYASNIRTIFEEARRLKITPIAIDLLPCDESLTQPVSWAPITYLNKDLETYSQRLHEVCENLNVQIIHLFEEWTNANYELWLDDGLHPNTEGHALIYEKVKEVIFPLTNSKE